MIYCSYLYLIRNIRTFKYFLTYVVSLIATRSHISYI